MRLIIQDDDGTEIYSEKYPEDDIQAMMDMLRVPFKRIPYRWGDGKYIHVRIAVEVQKAIHEHNVNKNMVAKKI